MTQPAPLMEQLVAEILRDSHRYVPGIERDLPTLIERSPGRRMLVLTRERIRDLVERVAARVNFIHRHYDAAPAGWHLGRLFELADGLEATSSRLGDEASRRALLDVLKLRVLGPHHAPLQITPEDYRRRQAYADRELRLKRATFEVADPYFSPLSLYHAPVNGHPSVSLHSHSVDLVSVFLLEQYSYRHGSHRVAAEPGDVVLDVGGCWGDTALYFASLVGAGGRVFTFEFDPENLKIMRANLALNPELAQRIEVVPRALWHTSRETLLFRPAGRMTTVGVTEPGDASTLQVPTVTLDDFVAERGLERVDYIKMDVEGAELDVMAGSRETVSRRTPKLGIAAYHRDDDLVRIPKAISALNQGYRLYVESFSPVEDETVLFAKVP